jgi:hypothetical protein
MDAPIESTLSRAQTSASAPMFCMTLHLGANSSELSDKGSVPLLAYATIRVMKLAQQKVWNSLYPMIGETLFPLCLKGLLLSWVQLTEQRDGFDFHLTIECYRYQVARRDDDDTPVIRNRTRSLSTSLALNISSNLFLILWLNPLLRHALSNPLCTLGRKKGIPLLGSCNTRQACAPRIHFITSICPEIEGQGVYSCGEARHVLTAGFPCSS